MSEALPLEETSIDKSAIEQLFTQAHTAYAFADTPVDETILRQAWDITKWAPTSANTQPARVLFVTSDESRQKLAALMADSNQERTAAAPVSAVIAMDWNYHRNIPTLIPPLASMADYFEKDEEARRKSGTFSTALQTGYFILALRALGLVAGPMGGFDAEGIDKEFFADTGWKSQLVINIGYPSEDSYRPRNPRLDEAEVLRFL